MKIGRASEIRDVLNKGKWAKTQIPDTWQERDEWELFREKSEIQLLELLRGTKPDKLSFSTNRENQKGQDVNEHLYSVYLR